MANRTRLTGVGFSPEQARELATQINAAITPASAIASLTGTVGTANDAMTAIAAATAATTDTTAASLASVNTSITAINNDFADLQAKVNAILAALRSTGVINT